MVAILLTTTMQLMLTAIAFLCIIVEKICSEDVAMHAGGVYAFALIDDVRWNQAIEETSDGLRHKQSLRHNV